MSEHAGAKVLVAAFVIVGGGIALGVNSCRHQSSNKETPSTPSSVAGLGGTRIGDVDTELKIVGSNHKIVVDAFNDPKIEGIRIYISKPVIGGVDGMLGIAEEASDVSIAVRQVGPIKVLENFDWDGDENVFSESRSLIFKELHLTRMYDREIGAFIYLTHSDKLVSGSPKNSVSAVMPEAWNGVAPDLQVLYEAGAPVPPNIPTGP